MNHIMNMELHKPQFTMNDLLISGRVIRMPEQVTYQSTNMFA